MRRVLQRFQLQRRRRGRATRGSRRRWHLLETVARALTPIGRTPLDLAAHPKPLLAPEGRENAGAPGSRTLCLSQSRIISECEASALPRELEPQMESQTYQVKSI
ncbi:hypothetical protein O181_053602 [Austropuccinia psidii MF-1]|uniref:Uncharacterized protein n=1 Tax=Austropuccinia psidii MF-1 TaxID=1389203 RepID=A0A9Q3E9Z6_9BASI|nr:hypothetical protein [Austropuccinia psidii MF-1]